MYLGLFTFRIPTISLLLSTLRNISHLHKEQEIMCSVFHLQDSCGSITIIISFHWLYSLLGPWPVIFQFHDHFIDGRILWTSDQPVARPLPKRRTTQTQNKHTHMPNIHALCGIRTHALSFRASEDSIRL
jgi:hypothetical protein